METWVIANQKGGVGKTTTAVTLAGLLAQRGNRVLLVDLDPHGSMTTYFGLDPDNMQNSIYSLFQSASDIRPHPTSIVRQTRHDGIELLPSSTALATLDRQLGTREGMGLLLRSALEQMEGEYDYAIIDCPPILGVLMVNALAATRTLLIPVQTEFLALKGLERMVHTLAMIERSRSEPFESRIIPTMFDQRTRASIESLRAMRNAYPEQIWGSVIPIDTQFRDASRKGMPPSFLNRYSRGVNAYRKLLDSLVSTDDIEFGERERIAP